MPPNIRCVVGMYGCRAQRSFFSSIEFRKSWNESSAERSVRPVDMCVKPPLASWRLGSETGPGLFAVFVLAVSSSAIGAAVTVMIEMSNDDRMNWIF